MRINLASVLVDDQEKALRFYTDVLGFVKKQDVPTGAHRWLTVVSPEAPDGVELLLEPDEHPAARPFKAALVEDGVPYTSFAVANVRSEFDRLKAAGVVFTQEPTTMGPVTTAVFDDTCGNLIQIAAMGYTARPGLAAGRPVLAGRRPRRVGSARPSGRAAGRCPSAGARSGPAAGDAAVAPEASASRRPSTR